MRPQKVPRAARRLHTYQELESYLADFARGEYPFLWVYGRPGISKTESIRAAMRGVSHLYLCGGQLTSARLHILAYRHRGQPIILDDDEDHLLRDPIGHKQFYSLGDTKNPKPMNWWSTSSALGAVPESYLTTSPLCIVANRPPDDAALQSRARMLYFGPLAAEIHRAVARWYWDQEIHDWIGQQLASLGDIEMRHYLDAAQDKATGRDWRRHLLTACATPAGRLEALVREIEADRSCTTREAQTARFLELAGARGAGRGASRATYFRLRRRLEEDGRLSSAGVARIVLCRQRPPPRASQEEADALAERARAEEAAPAEASQAEAPPDVPLRLAFVQPVTGHTPGPGQQTAQPSRQRLDDLLPGEEPEPPDDET